MGLPKSGIVASVRPLTGCISLSRDVWFVRLLVWKMHGDAPPPPPVLKMQLHYTLCSQTASFCDAHSLLSCAVSLLLKVHQNSLLPVLCNVYGQRGVRLSNLELAPRAALSPQTNSPTLTSHSLNPFWAKYIICIFKTKLNIHVPKKHPCLDEIASWKVFADMGGVCKEIKFLVDYSQLNSCHLHTKMMTKTQGSQVERWKGWFCARYHGGTLPHVPYVIINCFEPLKFTILIARSTFLSIYTVLLNLSQSLQFAISVFLGLHPMSCF